MIDVVLAAVCAALMVFHVQQAGQWSRERTRFVHALLSRGPADFAALERSAEPDKRRPFLRRRELSEDGQDVDEIIAVGL